MSQFLKNENHLVIHGWMINELELKGLPLMIFAIIYGFSQTDKQCFTGSLSYFSDWTGATRRGCIKAINDLVKKGYINKFVSPDDKRTSYSTLYFGGSELCSLGGSELSSPVVVNLVHHPSNKDNNNYKEKENIVDNKLSTIKEKETFDLFWEKYPRKVAKANAKNAWDKIAPPPEQAAAIIACVEDNVKNNEQWNRDNGQFIPYPATWLHQRRWEDEITTKQQPTETKYEVEL